MSWVSIPKPTGATYTNVRNGFVLWDDPGVAYDDSMYFYDGFDPNVYTNVAKPTSSTWTTISKPT